MKPSNSRAIHLIFISIFIPISISQATVATLEQIQAATAGVAYQYTFEGADNAARQTDKIEGVVLSQVGTASSIGYATSELTNTGVAPTPPRVGFDSSSFALFTGRLNATNGRALQNSTAGAFTLPQSGTIEFLFRANVSFDGFGLAAGATGGTQPRFSFLYNQSSTAYATFGENAGEALIGGTSGVTYTLDHWYYVAQTWSIDSITGGTVTFNAWVADLTAGATTLTQTINGATNAFDATSLASSTFRLGYNGTNSSYSNSGIDALAIYNSVLTSAVFQSHVDAILVPEPSTAILTGLAFGIFGVFLTRKRKLVSAK